MAELRAPTSTDCVHAGEKPPRVGPLETPLVLSSAFALGDADEAAAAFRGDNDHHIYGRWGNPSVEQLEAKLAALEAGQAAVATSSGMAAVAGALLSNLTSGDHLICPLSCYGETSRLVRERLPRFGITASFVDATLPAEIKGAFRDNTRAVYLETPANPTLSISDIAAVAELSRARGATLIVDNTFATPICQRPLELGADLVLHSMTKALGGHGDAIGGALIGRSEAVDAARELLVKGLGAVIAPFNAFLIARGLRTLALRQRQATASALTLAQRLEGHPALLRVHYPGLTSHPGHEVARRQMSGFGTLLAFELKGGLDAGRALLSRVELIAHAVSLGDVRSLITHPASTTASTMPPELRRAAGIGEGLIRLSVGIEEVDDLYRDLCRGLG